MLEFPQRFDVFDLVARGFERLKVDEVSQDTYVADAVAREPESPYRGKAIQRGEVADLVELERQDSPKPNVLDPHDPGDSIRVGSDRPATTAREECASKNVISLDSDRSANRLLEVSILERWYCRSGVAGAQRVGL